MAGQPQAPANTTTLQYIQSPDSDFSLGIDVRSAENQIDPGFVRDLLNADVVEKRVRKRQGYQGYAGNLPVRVTRVTYDGSAHTASLALDSSISLQSPIALDMVRSSPLLVYGRSSVFTSGPFTTSGDSLHYYNSFGTPNRKGLTAPSGTLTIPGSEHGLNSSTIFTGVVESTNVINRSYDSIITDSIAVDTSSFNVSVGYTVEADTTAFVYYKDATTVTGSTYVASFSHTGSPVSQTFTISAATHDLDNFNILAQVQQVLGGTRSNVIPDSILIATNGDVSITLSNDTGSSLSYDVLLSACPIANIKNGVINAQSSGTVTLSGLTKPWIFTSIYLEQTPGGTRELVVADSISYDDTTSSATVSFTNQSTTARNFIIYYDYGDIRSNLLTITDSSIVSTGVDNAPQLTIWGLDHDEIYTSKVAREGWVNHIDSYRRGGQQAMISGLGGNLYEAQDYALAATTYGYPTLYPRLSARTSTNQILGPLLWGTGELPGRTRGYLTADGAGTHWATVTGVQFDTGTGLTRYTISVPNLAVLDSTGAPTTLSAVISTTSGLEDYFTVGSMSYKIHEGVFKIEQAIAVDASTIQLLVDNPNVDSSDYDDLSTAGEGGVFTDQFTWLTTAPFVPNDILVSEPLGDTFICTVQSSSGQITVTSGIVDRLELPGGLLFTGKRTSSIVPLRTGAPSSAPSVSNLVRGDMLSYSEIERQLRVLYINSGNDLNSTVSGDGTTGTVTISGGTTQYLTVGQDILLSEAGDYSGQHTITDIPSSTTLTFDTTLTSSSSAILVGNTMQVDEQLTWSDTSGDTNEFQVQTRWIPIEAPDDTFGLTPSTHVRYLDSNTYTDQPFLRSTMSLNNMYFTNYDDPVYKFEGAHNYRSGLIDWQPALFLTQDTSGAVIAAGLRTLTYSAIVPAQGKLTITEAQTNVLPVGTTVKLTGSQTEYTVTSYTDDTATGGTNFYLQVDKALDATVAATGSIVELGIYKYYFRLNAVDINNNVIASAATNSSDYSVELTGNAAIQLKLIGMPVWDVYDYARLEVQIYRTKKNQSAPFYLVTTLPMDFNNTTGYLVFRDSFADSDLTQLDAVNTALKGQELGTAWTSPLRAKYLTSINNRLVLANVQDYPQLDIQIVGDATLSASTLAGGTLLFRKDITDSGVISDTVNRLRLEWVNGVSGTVSAFTPGTNTFTFTTSSATGAAVGNWIYLTYGTVATSGRDLTYCGWYQIAAISGTSVTVNLTGATAASSYPDKYVVANTRSNIPVLLGADGSLGTIGSNLFDTFDAMFRMSLAINAVMRMTDTSISGMESFTPWIISRAGNDLTPAGRLIVKQPLNSPTSLAVLPTFSGYSLFINAVRATSGISVSAATRLYPSRIIVSYQNYPEIFDNPTSVLDTDSDSAIDINSADGQEITGVIPFFGSAAFSAAQQTAVLVVFKTNSVYLVDLGAKAAGQPAVQRLETEGLGCTAPYSIASTKSGIMFANESGMYVLRRNQAIEYIGRFMERNWQERVSLTNLGLVHGHHFGVQRLYKLSVPLTSEITPVTGYLEPSEVYVYNHTGEDQTVNTYTPGRGAWSRYDNHPAIGWANLLSNAYFASTKGRVFVVRQTGLLSDYRDDSSPITFTLTSRANDFGNTGIRKVIDAIVVDYRTGSENLNTSLDFAVDLSNEFEPTTPLIIPQPSNTTDLSDSVGSSVVPILHKLDRRRGIFFNVQITNDGLDENLEIAGLNYKVAALTDKGIQQAAQTTSKKGST